jgi:hypothetical protein
MKIDPLEAVGQMINIIGSDDYIAAYHELDDRGYSETTKFMGGVLGELAIRYGATQCTERWSVDYLWMDSPETHQYWSGNGPVRFPLGQVLLAIEHENYGVENIGAALLRLAGIRANTRLLIGWSEHPEDDLESLEKIVCVRARRLGALQMDNPVYVALFHEDSKSPKATIRLVDGDLSHPLITKGVEIQAP